ncbi:MAG: WYL domain-containing protein [Chloroflexi bacterium]|nr:WYL domain-containing protein [Chloroflexota bacterium]
MFDLEARLATGWRIMAGDESIEVRLRFAPDIQAQVAERQWHPSQTIETTADGGCLLTVCVAKPQEMKPWIRSWGRRWRCWLPAGCGPILPRKCARRPRCMRPNGWRR